MPVDDSVCVVVGVDVEVGVGAMQATKSILPFVPLDPETVDCAMKVVAL